MTINIREHYFSEYAGHSELQELFGFRIGEIVTDWEGKTGCILTISEYGDVRTDSNGTGDIAKLKKVRSKKKIADYLKDLFRADIELATFYYKKDLERLEKRD